jgi:GR25 family glycosyltransferase involved in LPS biosynthesis
MDRLKQYVINLKRRPDRLQYFYDHFPFEKTNVEVVYGFDGKYFEKENEREVQIFHNLPNNLLPGEKGCLISHLRIYKDIIDKNIPFAVVMEDDGIFCENFKDKINEIINELPDDCQILYFGGRFEPYFKMDPGTFISFSNKIVSHVQIKWEQRSWRNHDRTTHGYIISYNLAKFFIDCFNRNMYLDCAIDNWMLRICMNNNIKILNASPLLSYSAVNSKESDIRGHLL